MGVRLNMNPNSIVPESQLIAEQQTASQPIQPSLPKIKIRNKITGEIREVDPMRAQDFGLDPGEALNRVKAINELQGISEGKTTQTEGQQTKSNLAKTGLGSLKHVNEFLQEDPSIVSKQLIPGKFESRSFDSALFGAVDTLLRIRTGATAPEEEIRRYMAAYGPQPGDKPSDIEFKMGQLRDALTNEGGLTESEANKLFPFTKKEKQSSGGNKEEPSSTQISDARKALSPEGGLQGNFLSEILMPRTTKIAREGRSAKNIDEAAGILGEVAPYAGMAFGPAGMAIGGAVHGATEPGADIGTRAKNAAIEGAVAGLGGKALQLGGKALGATGRAITGKGVTSAGLAREALSKESSAVFSGNDYAKALDEYVSKDPLAAGIADRLKQGLADKKFDANQIVNKLEVWNKAYSQAGNVGKSEKAGAYNALANFARDQLKEKAPDVYAAQKALATEIGRKKIADKVLEPASLIKAALSTALAAGVGAGAYKMFGK